MMPRCTYYIETWTRSGEREFIDRFLIICPNLDTYFSEIKSDNESMDLEEQTILEYACSFDLEWDEEQDAYWGDLELHSVQTMKRLSTADAIAMRKHLPVSDMMCEFEDKYNQLTKNKGVA
jgi:hypothetical protein|tara:strand:- start:42 stop:404 length:363 start_codon:yes stop_codon:yes gene_type:complete